MPNTNLNKIELEENGFTVIENIYSDEEITKILKIIENADTSNPNFRQSTDLFAIRRFLIEISETIKPIFNQNLKNVISAYLGNNYFVVKSIYFDKPGQSNWFVSYHQDLTISVDKKINLENYGPWTVKQDVFSVRPPMEILKNIFTIRIHLDNTDEYNGALKVISGSHLKDIYRPENIDWNLSSESICKVNKGGLMIMKPLLLHSSSRTTDNRKRRVIHIEFSSIELQEQLNWAEKLNI